MAQERKTDATMTSVAVPIDGQSLPGDLGMPSNAQGIVLFAHGSGSSRHSSRNQYVARTLEHRNLATLLIDLLTPEEEAVSEATVKLVASGVRYVETGEGNGPVNALDQALRQALVQAFPEVAKFELIDYKVRILDQGHGTDAITRVLIETSDGESSWVTVGVGHNVIEASWEALKHGGRLVVNAVTPTALRFAPSLLVTDDEIDEAVTIVGKALA